MQDGHSFAPLACELLQPLGEVDFLADEQLGAEAANLPERGRFAEDERSCRPAPEAAEEIPSANGHSRHQILLCNGNGAATGENASGLNHLRDIPEQPMAWMRIRIHEDQPFTRCHCCAGVPGAADLVDGLEDDFCSPAACELCRAIGRVVVADDGFDCPAEFAEGR